jgi:hypothetical protein
VVEKLGKCNVVKYRQLETELEWRERERGRERERRKVLITLSPAITISRK